MLEQVWSSSLVPNGSILYLFNSVQSVLDTGKKLSDDNTIGQEEIQQRLAQFVDHWKELKDLSGAR